MAEDQQQPLWIQDLLEWLEQIKTITDNEVKGKALASFVSELPPSKSSVLEQALDAAQKIKDEGYRAEVLALIAPQLPPTQRQEILKLALDAAQNFQSERDRAYVLAKIAPQLPPTEPQLLKQIFKLNSNSSYIQALSKIAFRFPEEVAASIPSYKFFATL